MNCDPLPKLGTGTLGGPSHYHGTKEARRGRLSRRKIATEITEVTERFQFIFSSLSVSSVLSVATLLSPCESPKLDPDLRRTFFTNAS